MTINCKAERMRQRYWLLQKHPNLMEKAVAQHYASLSHTSISLLKLIEMRERGMEGLEDVIKAHKENMDQAYRDDFGLESNLFKSSQITQELYDN